MLNQYSTSGAIKKAIDGVQYKSGGTHTDEAIAYAVNNMFTPAGGARSGSSKVHTVLIGVRVIVFNATFNNISVISWQSVLLVEETRVPGITPPICRKSLSHFI